MKKNETKLIYQAIIPTKISISPMEKNFSFLIFQEETFPFWETFPKMDVLVFIFGKISKNGYITKMTTVCPTEMQKYLFSISELKSFNGEQTRHSQAPHNRLPDLNPAQTRVSDVLNSAHQHGRGHTV